MITQQARIKGFVKRAADYGYSPVEAITLWKRANNQGMMSSLGQVFNNLKNKFTPASKGYPQPIGPAKPESSIGYDAPLEPKQDPMWPAPAPGAPKSHIPQGPGNRGSAAVQDSNISSEVNNQLTSIPLSGMTPKNHWEQGLHDIMAKKPVFNPQLRPFAGTHHYFNGNDRDRPMVYEYGPEGSEGDYNFSTAVDAPQPIDIASENVRDLMNAASSEKEHYTKGNGHFYHGSRENVENNPHIHQLREHFKKYDPSWGSSFRLPIQNFDAASDDDENFDFNKSVERLDDYKKGFNFRFQNLLNSRISQPTGSQSPYQIASRND